MLLQKALNVSLPRQSLADRFDPFLEISYDNSDLWFLPLDVAPVTQQHITLLNQTILPW